MAKRVKNSAATKGFIGIDPLAWLDESDLAAMAEKSDASNQNDDQTQAQNPSKPEGMVETTEREVGAGTDRCDAPLNNPVPKPVVLADILRLESVIELRDKLNDRLQQSEASNIDASEVEIIDTASLQLIYAFFRETARLGKSAKIENPSKNFVEAATLLGLDESLGLIGEAPGLG